MTAPNPTPPQPAPPGLTAGLVARARALRYADLPPEVLAAARHCVLDWLGVTLAGYLEPSAALVREQVLADGGHPEATLIGSGERVARTQAALVNGTASHALDFDDVNSAMSGHPTVPVLPALLAVTEHSGLNGAAFLTAFVAGFETECRIGRLMAPGHYERGFHATATVGTFGAAAASAHALGLAEPAWRAAFGLAGTQAAGLKSMFGTMAKPLHAGRAAASGLTAALLAGRGVTAHPDVLDVAQGFTDTLGGPVVPPAPEVVDRALHDDHFHILDVLFKYHAACYLTHSSIEGLLRLRGSGLRPGDVETIDLRVPPGHLAVCDIAEPATALEGKFSLRFTSAMALATGDLSERAFTPAVVRDPELIALRDRVTVHGAPDLRRSRRTEVRVGCVDGRVLHESVDVFAPTPAAELDHRWEALRRKFTALADPVLGAARSAAIVEAVAALDTAPSLQALLPTA
jgi:2-methylcitrate dehydratase PrpD